MARRIFRGNTLKSPQIGAGAVGQTGRGRALEHQILNPMFLAVFALAAFVAILVHRVNVLFQKLDFRVGIQPSPLEISACFTYLIESTT